MMSLALLRARLRDAQQQTARRAVAAATTTTTVPAIPGTERRATTVGVAEGTPKLLYTAIRATTAYNSFRAGAGGGGERDRHAADYSPLSTGSFSLVSNDRRMRRQQGFASLPGKQQPCCWGNPRSISSISSISNNSSNNSSTHKERKSIRWVNRRPLCAAASSAGGSGKDDGGEDTSNGGKDSSSGSASFNNSINSGNGSSVREEGGNPLLLDDERQQKGAKVKGKRRKREARKPMGKPFPFGKPLELLLEEEKRSGDLIFSGGDAEEEAADKLPTLFEIQVDNKDDDDDDGDDGGGGDVDGGGSGNDGDGDGDGDGDSRTCSGGASSGKRERRVTNNSGRASAARPEIVHAISRGLVEARIRDVTKNLSAFLGIGSFTSKETLNKLEKKMAKHPHQAEWVMPLIRDHLEEKKKPSEKTHEEHLRYVRETNTKNFSLEDMAEILIHSHSRIDWTPAMTRDTLKTTYPSRWKEAMVLAEKLADRLPVSKHQLMGEKLESFLKAEKLKRRGRLLSGLIATLQMHAHLALPAMAKFWRVTLSEGQKEAVTQTKEKHRKLQALLAGWLNKARWKTQTKLVEDESALAGPWSIEEIEEKQYVRIQKKQADEREKATADILRHDHDADNINDLISLALPPEAPESMPALAPMGLIRLHVFEIPREFNTPPPRDIFGGDTPLGIGEAGSGKIPIWKGRDEKATRGMQVGDEYLWPEVREEKEKEKEAAEAAAGGEGWAEGAGTMNLSAARSRDYQEVEDVLLTGKRLKRPLELAYEEFEKDLRMQAIKTRLLRRSALVAELHPDETRLNELRLEEEVRRTVFLKDLPDGTNAAAIKDAFTRCGKVERVVLKQPLFRLKQSTSRKKITSQRFIPQPRNSYAHSTVHGFAVFEDEKGYAKATSKAFRIFGAHICKAAVPTSPAIDCRTVFVENLYMKTGQELVDEINETIQPHYEVMLETHALDDDRPQAVSLRLRTYVAARGVEKLLRTSGLYTAFHYVFPSPKENSHDIDENRSIIDTWEERQRQDIFPNHSEEPPQQQQEEEGGGGSGQERDGRSAEMVAFEKIMALSEQAAQLARPGSTSLDKWAREVSAGYRITSHFTGLGDDDHHNGGDDRDGDYGGNDGGDDNDYADEKKTTGEATADDGDFDGDDGFHSDLSWFGDGDGGKSGPLDR